MKIVVYDQPIGKPRMTRADQWKRREVVLRYRSWADLARVTAFKKNVKLRLSKPTRLGVTAYFSSTKRRMGPHLQKPDADNIIKACADALFHNDEMIYEMTVRKLWANGGAPRMEIEWDE